MTLYQSRESTTLTDNTTKIIYLTVPKGKIWILKGIRMHNGDDVDRSCAVAVVDANNNEIFKLSSVTIPAGQARMMLPFLTTAESTDVAPFNFPIKGGNKLKLYWGAGGASSGGTSYYSVIYEEVVE